MSDDTHDPRLIETRHQAAVEWREILAKTGHTLPDDVRKGFGKLLESLEGGDEAMTEQSLPANEVAERMRHAGTQLRKGLEECVPDDRREAILETFNEAIAATVKAVTKAFEEGGA